MNPARAGIILIALGAALTGYGLRILQEARGHVADATALEARIARLETNSTAGSGIASSGIPANGPHHGPRASLSDRLANPGSASGRAAPSVQEMARIQAARRTELDAQFRRESIDATWARQAESALSTAASSDDLVESGILPTSISSECRSRRCRIVARFNPGDDYDGWASSYVLSAAGTLATAETVSSTNPDGSTELVIYGARP